MNHVHFHTWASACFIAGTLALPASALADGPKARVERRVVPQIHTKRALKRRPRPPKTVHVAVSKRRQAYPTQGAVVQRLRDQRVRGRLAKPNVVIWLPRAFKAPTELMSTRVWRPAWANHDPTPARGVAVALQ